MRAVTSALVVGVRIVGAGLQAVLVTLIANGLSPADFGLFSAVYVFWGLVRMLGPLGLDQVAMREIASARARGEGDRAAAIARLTIKRTVQVSAAVAAVTLVALWAGMGQASPALLLLVPAAVPAFSYIAIMSAHLRAVERAPLAQTLESVVLPLASAAAVLALLVSGELDVWRALAACGAAAWLVAFWCWLCRPAPSPPRGLGDLPDAAVETRSLWRDAAQIWQALVVTGLSVRAPTYIGLMVLGLANTAILEIAIRFGTLPTLFTSGVNATLAPAIAARHARRREKGVSTIASLAGWGAMLPSLMVLLAMAVAGREFLAWFFPAPYQAAFYPLLLVCAATTVNAALSPASSILLMTGGQRTARLFSIVQLGVVCALSLVLGHAFGIEGVCWAILAGTLVRDGGLAYGLKRQGVVAYPSLRRARILLRAANRSAFAARRRRHLAG
jgi:O-antigen/teichoic acid export membrane protein